MTTNIRPIVGWVLALALATATVPAASAHSLEDVKAMLGDKEKYFQPIDKPAPDFTLQTADGRVVGLTDLRGQIIVLHFIYTRCPDVCPLHAERIAELQALVNQTPMKDQVRFITVTTDPKNDTADVMQDYGPAHGLNPANWLFLTTTPDQPEDTTRRLAEAYGHKFKVTEDGLQLHGIVTHVIDKEGHWRANFHGLKFAPVNFVVFTNALVNDAKRPHGHEAKSWWDRLRSLF